MRFRRKPEGHDQSVEKLLKTLMHRSGEFIHRNRGVSAVAGLLLLGGVAASIWQAHRANVAQAGGAHPSTDLRQFADSRPHNYYDPLNDFSGAMRIHEGRMGVVTPNERQSVANVDNSIESATEGFRPAALDNLSAAPPAYHEVVADNSRGRSYIQPFPLTYPYPGGVSFLTGFDLNALGPNAADFLVQINKPQLALAAFQKRLASDEQAAAANPGNSQVQTDLAYSSSRIGDLLLAMGDQAGAIPYFQHAVDVYTKNNATIGTPDPASTLQISRLLGKLAKLHAMSGLTEKAIAEGNKATDILDQLAADTTDVDQRRLIASAYEDIGDAYFFLAGDTRTPQSLMKKLWAAARAAYVPSLAILEGLENQGLATADESAEIDTISHEIAETELFLAK